MREEIISAKEARKLSEQERHKKDNTIEEGAWNEAVRNIKEAISNGKNCAYTYKFPMTSALKKKLESEEFGYKVSTDHLISAMSRIVW